MQLRGRRRIDGVGRPKFDYYTGLRGTGLRGTLLRALASAARRRRPPLRARSSCAPRVVVWPRVSAYILTPGSHPTALRRASVTERALHFTAAVQAVGASERDGAGAAGVAGRVHGFGATGGDTDLYGRLRSTSPKAVAYSWCTRQLLGHPRGLVGVSEVCRLGALILCRNQPVVFFYGDTGLYARELRRAGLALVETKLCSSRCSRHSVQGHDRRPLRLGIVSSFVMKPIGEPAARGLGALYCLTATSCSTV
jgi:hypothetical protein